MVKPKKACKIFGFSETSMSKYIKEYKQDQEASYNYKKQGVTICQATNKIVHDDKLKCARIWKIF
jgi:hypothetical protein